MSELDDELMRAMRRVDAPEGFAERVMARAESVEAPAQVSEARPEAPAHVASAPRKVLVMKPRFAARRVPMWFGGAIAAVLVLGVFAGERVHEQHERAAATQEFETATRITDQALEHTRRQLEKAGVRLE